MRNSLSPLKRHTTKTENFLNQVPRNSCYQLLHYHLIKPQTCRLMTHRPLKNRMPPVMISIEDQIPKDITNLIGSEFWQSTHPKIGSKKHLKVYCT
ncbi:hypothetical protein CDAR_379601 [Caerostris darwini]|uniref:Uncharacterized protein n=1 Tax=Caerostris darwini TaxID=1538125 RepID=A0AAV4RNH7_9ARAC|nr:hypothetical protein CDAR_379601 [Caerostris darwini]